MMYYADRKRHLVCIPYTKAGLVAMAEDLGIDHRVWYHGGAHPHIDIPKRRLDEILAHPEVTVVTPRDIVNITAGGPIDDRRF